MSKGFLPLSRGDMEDKGWEWVDFSYVIGDAYVDHSSFGPAVISRLLEAHGYRVGIISQPDWRTEESVKIYGKPRLGYLVSAGNMDSMVNHFTVGKKRRRQDAYTPGGAIGKRPDRAVTVYGNLIRKAYRDVPVIAGGIEASLRRLGHYDYWSDKVKRSVLLDSGADLISYGMGEHSILEIAEALNSGMAVSDITYIRGTVYKTRSAEGLSDGIFLPSFEEICQSKKKYAESFFLQYQNTDPFSGKCLVEKYRDWEYVVQNPPALPLTEQEMDDVYRLPYERACHPSYEELGGVPALSELKYSLTSSRGCFGGCNFCALTFHQGRMIQTRSHESLLEEARAFTEEKDFKGYIHDVGGPTANFRQPSCKKQRTRGVCKNRQCLFPKPCPNLEASHKDYVLLLRKLRQLPKVKKVFIRSGIRFDYLLADQDQTFLFELNKHHISGQLRVAPEHVSDAVLSCMGKPSHKVYEAFLKKEDKINQKIGKKQYVLPYFMSSHPGCTMKEAVKLAEYIRDMGFIPEQAQDFYPTPSTLSTCMYYTGWNPETMEKVYVPKGAHEKEMQRALIQYRNPANYTLVLEALKKAGRMDLVGYGPKCLIRPPQDRKACRDPERGGNTKGRGKKRKMEDTVRKKKPSGGNNGANKRNMENKKM